MEVYPIFQQKMPFICLVFSCISQKASGSRNNNKQHQSENCICNKNQNWQISEHRKSKIRGQLIKAFYVGSINLILFIILKNIEVVFRNIVPIFKMNNQILFNNSVIILFTPSWISWNLPLYMKAGEVMILFFSSMQTSWTSLLT